MQNFNFKYILRGVDIKKVQRKYLFYKRILSGMVSAKQFYLLLFEIALRQFLQISKL